MSLCVTQSQPQQHTRERHKPERRCIVTGDVRPVSDLLRFVASPDNRLVFDIKARLPGRGVWVSNHRATLEQAIREKRFAKSLKLKVTVDRDLPEQVEKQLRKAFLSSLGLAYRAGALIIGSEPILAERSEHPFGLLVTAQDASPRSRQDVQKRCPADVVIESVGREELEEALGRQNVVYIAAKSAILPDHLATAGLRLSRFNATGTHVRSA